MNTAHISKPQVTWHSPEPCIVAHVMNEHRPHALFASRALSRPCCSWSQLACLNRRTPTSDASLCSSMIDKATSFRMTTQPSRYRIMRASSALTGAGRREQPAASRDRTQRLPFFGCGREPDAITLDHRRRPPSSRNRNLPANVLRLTPRQWQPLFIRHTLPRRSTKLRPIRRRNEQQK